MADFCPPIPSVLNIGQFLDKGVDVKNCVSWMLAYAPAIQCMGEAAEGRMWHANGMHFSSQVSLLVDAFIVETDAGLTELEIASCWSEETMQVALQKKDTPFVHITAFLDELA